MVKNPLQCGRPGFHPWVGKIPWRRAWKPTPVFFPGESHAQRSLAHYSPWGHKELDMTEQLSTARHRGFCRWRYPGTWYGENILSWVPWQGRGLAHNSVSKGRCRVCPETGCRVGSNCLSLQGAGAAEERVRVTVWTWFWEKWRCQPHFSSAR